MLGMRINPHMRIIAASENNLFFVRGCDLSGANPDPGLPALPLAQFLSGEFDSRQLSAFQKTRSRSLLVVPDHWVKHDFFLFKSQKESLIRPFIERKIKTAYPHLAAAQHFFSYGCRQNAMAGPGLRVFHLCEPRAFDLYTALARLNLTPRWITTPALLWEERLNRQMDGFAGQAVLAIHLQSQEGFLYFYHQGDFLFSREVVLADSADRWDALLFEINQSIYLFSQKARSDLQSVYLIGGDTAFQERLAEFLGRPVQMMSAPGPRPALPRDLAALDGLLEPEGVPAPADAHCITHSAIRQRLKWRPVQWTGMLVAATLLVFFTGESQWLAQRLAREVEARSQMLRQQPLSLADHDAAVVAVTDDLRRPSPAHTIFNVVSALPEGVSLHEFKMDPDAMRADLAATVRADTIDRFRQLLKTLIENLNRRLQLSPPLTVEDLVVNLEETRHQPDRTDYTIACRIQLP
jgi:hypothetical protein